MSDNRFSLWGALAEIKSLVTLVLFCAVSGCITFSFGIQEKYNFEAVYYMDGRCAIVLPNRNGVFVFNGMSLTESLAPPYYFGSEPNIYNVTCSVDRRTGYNGIGDARASVELIDIPAILYTKENTVKLNHNVQPGGFTVENRERYRYIQHPESIVLGSGAFEVDKGVKLQGLDSALRVDKDRNLNYRLQYSFSFQWAGQYGRQLPGVTRHVCDASFKATDVRLTIYGSETAAETGVYAIAEGENGEIVQNGCK
jgi:hypothetical protein